MVRNGVFAGVTSLSLSFIPKGSPAVRGETPPSVHQSHRSDFAMVAKSVSPSLSPFQQKKLEKHNLFSFISSSSKPLLLPTATTSLISSVRDIINGRERKGISVFSDMLSKATKGKVEGRTDKAPDGDNGIDSKDLISMVSAFRFVLATVLGECLIRVGDNEDHSSKSMSTAINKFIRCIPSIGMSWGCAIIEALVYIIREAEELRILSEKSELNVKCSQEALGFAKFKIYSSKLTLTNERGDIYQIPNEDDNKALLLPCLSSSLLLHPLFGQCFEQLTAVLIGALITDESLCFI
jgi:hypothetical protein